MILLIYLQNFTGVNNMKNRTKKDIIIIVALIIFAAASAIVIFSLPSKGKTVNVQVDNKPYGSYSLFKNKTVKIKTEKGYNVLKIQNGYTWIEKADCKNQVCVHHKKINKSGENIVCLPHGVIISVGADENE